MATIEFHWDSSQVAALTGKGVERALVSALRKAGGDAIRAVRAESKRRIRERTRIRAGYLADRSFPLGFPRGAALSEMAWRMDVSGAEVPLGEYPARQNRRGVVVEVERGKKVLVRSAFMRKGHGARQGVFLRPTERRYPMGHRLGMRVSDAMADGRAPNAALERGVRVLGSAFERLLALELGKLG